MIKFIKRKRKKEVSSGIEEIMLSLLGIKQIGWCYIIEQMVFLWRQFFHHLLIIFLLFFRLTSRRGITTTLLTNMTMFIEFHGPCWVACQQNEKDVFTVTIMLFVVDTFPLVLQNFLFYFFILFWGFVRELNAI